MKVFSTIVKLILLSAVMTVATTSCDSDIDPVYVLSGNSMELMGGPNEVILTPDNPQALAACSNRCFSSWVTRIFSWMVRFSMCFLLC